MFIFRTDQHVESWTSHYVLPFFLKSIIQCLVSWLDFSHTHKCNTGFYEFDPISVKACLWSCLPNCLNTCTRNCLPPGEMWTFARNLKALIPPLSLPHAFRDRHACIGLHTHAHAGLRGRCLPPVGTCSRDSDGPRGGLCPWHWHIRLALKHTGLLTHMLTHIPCTELDGYFKTGKALLLHLFSGGKYISSFYITFIE